MANQTTLIKRLGVKPSRQFSSVKALLAMLCLLFVTAQSIDLTHSHGGDLNLQADCDICLKLSSDDDVLVSSALSNAGSYVSTETVPVTLDVPAADILTAHARAPPLA